jgi:GGDEF domain-containing protein
VSFSEVRVESERAAAAALSVRRVAAVFDEVPERERLRAVLALGSALTGLESAVVMVGDAVVAAFPGAADGRNAERLAQRARGVFESELLDAPHYVARIGTRREGRLVLRWGGDGAPVVRARALATLCGWALDAGELADLPFSVGDRETTLSRAEQLVRDAMRNRRRFALLYVGVEETLRAAGSDRRDLLAQGLRRVVRATDHVGYLGADAFAVLIALDGQEVEAFVAAQRVLAAAASERLPAHVGVAVCPEDGARVEDLLEKASAAALAATSARSELPYWYREETGRDLRRQVEATTRLRLVADAQALQLRCQPLFDAFTGEPCAVFAEAAPPQAAAEPGDAPVDGRLRASLDRWTVVAAAELPQDSLAGCLYLRVGTLTPDLVEAIVTRFGLRQHGRHLALALRGGTVEPTVATLAALRRLRSLGIAIGLDALGAGLLAERGAIGIDLDFVTVGGGTNVGVLAALACGAVLAPQVVALDVRSVEEARWLAHHGATMVCGPGLGEPVGAREIDALAEREIGL